MQFFRENNYFRKDNQRNNSLYLFKHTNMTTPYVHEKNLFSFKTFQSYLKQNFSKEMFLYFLFFNKAYKPILTKINLKSYKIYENLTHKQIKREITLSKPNKAKVHKDDSRLFYLIKIKSRTS
jgi:hypothetical protein